MRVPAFHRSAAGNTPPPPSSTPPSSSSPSPSPPRSSSLLNDAIREEVTARLGFIYFIRCGQNAKLLILRLMRGCGSSVSSISRAEQTLAQGGGEAGEGASRLICKVNAAAYLS